MALKLKKPPAADTPPVARPRTEERQREQAETQNTIDDLQKKIMAHGRQPEQTPSGEEPQGDIDTSRSDAVPVGGDKTEVPPQQPPVAIITPPKTDGIETDEQLEKRLNEYQPSSPDQKKGFPILKAEIKAKNTLAATLQKQADDAKKELDELRKKVLPEDELNRLREADKLVKLRAVDTLPRWKEYDKQIEQIGSDAGSMLKGFGIPDQVLKVINEKRGGIIKFMSSDKPAGKQFTNPDGSEMTEAQWFEKNVMKRLNTLQQGQFAALTKDAISKQQEKERELELARTNADQTLEQETKSFWDKFNSEADTKLKELIPTLLPKLGLPIEIPILSGTETPEEKAQKERDIADWKKADGLVLKNVKVVTASDRTEVGLKSALFDVLIDGRWQQMKKDADEGRAAKEELQKLKDGVKDARRLSRSTTPEPVTPAKETKFISTEEAMANAGFKVGG